PLGSAGLSLLNDSQALSKVSDVLPSVLASVASKNPLDGATFAQQVRDGIRDALGGKPLSGAVGRAADVVSDSLSDKPLDHLLQRVCTDSSRLAQELLAPPADVVKHTSDRLARPSEEGAHRLTDDL